MATSLLPALALGPVSLLGQALTKFQRATSAPSWLYITIEPFLRASSILPCSPILRHCHISIASVMPRLSVMLFHFIRPGTFMMMNSPLGPLALYSTTSFSLPRPLHSRNAPTTCPWNSTPNHAETTGLAVDIYLLLQRQTSRPTYRARQSGQDAALDYAPPPAHWLRRKTTNSAGFTGAKPMSMNNWPRSRTSGGFSSSSHLTKKASCGVRPKSIPSRHAPVRNASTSRLTRAHRSGSFGSKTTHCVPRSMDDST